MQKHKKEKISESTLPDYQTPPVVEVAISLQFEPLRRLRTPFIGLLWKEYTEKGLSIVQEHQLLNQYFEFFGEEELIPRVEISRDPPVPRCWFLNKEGTELVQVQLDRFVHNWRRKDFSSDYIRFESIMEKFLEDLKIFKRFIHEFKIGDLRPNQCELTYVNNIPFNEIFESYDQIHNVINTFDVKYSDSFLENIERIGFDIKYIIRDKREKPLGRLHITAKPATFENQTQGIQLTLVARGKPEDRTEEKIIDFFHIGREWIVRGFTSITTQKMHEVWGRIR